MNNVNLVASLVWSVVGLLIGYAIGRYHECVKRRRCPELPGVIEPNAPRAARKTPGADSPGAATRPVRGPWMAGDWGSFTRTMTGIVILILVTTSLVSFYRVTSCQAGYNASVTRAIAARSEQQAAQLDRSIEQLQAQLVLLDPWTGDKNDTQARQAEGERRSNVYRDSVKANLDALIELRDSRNAYPLPDAAGCGDQRR